MANKFIPHDLPTSVVSNNQRPRIQISTVKNANDFSSLLTDGSMFDLQEARVHSSGRTMIVATNQPDDPDANPEDAEWVGTLSILSPAHLSERPRDKPLPPHILDATRAGEAELYILIGVWVNPEYRRHGIGRMLIEHALEMIRLQPAENEPKSDIPILELVDPGLGRQNDGKEGTSRDGTATKFKRRLVMLHVRENNDTAREMYAKIGFLREKSAGEEDSKSDWMCISISD